MRPEFIRGDVVECIHPVNGLKYMGRYEVIGLGRYDALGPSLLVKSLDGALLPPTADLGFFPWRFRAVPN